MNRNEVKQSRLVALVGRPNVGKSRLFNRLTGRRISIVHDQPGVTRDLVTADMNGNYVLMDTGGIGLISEETPGDILKAAEEQVDLAIHAASIILLVIDGKEGVTPLDDMIAERLRNRGKTVIPVINKIDDFSQGDLADVGEYLKLGLGEPVPVSAEHNRNLPTLQGMIERELGSIPPDFPVQSRAGERIRISLVGRPNVGKSSLGNALLESNRLLVSDTPGTTRDAVEVDMDFDPADGSGRLKFRLYDTAGLRSKRKVRDSIQYFSTLRTQRAIENSDIVLLVLDAMEGVTRQDQRLAGEILEEGKALLILVNKWDYALETFKTQPLDSYRDEEDFKQSYKKAIHKEIFFLPESPVLFVSAKTGLALDSIMKAAGRLNTRMDTVLSTPALNKVIHDMLDKTPPRRIQAKRFKVFYAVQVGSRPFRIRLFCNKSSRLDESYRRYLAKGIMDTFGVHGCPIQFEYSDKERRFSNTRQPSSRGATIR